MLLSDPHHSLLCDPQRVQGLRPVPLELTEDTFDDTPAANALDHLVQDPHKLIFGHLKGFEQFLSVQRFEFTHKVLQLATLETLATVQHQVREFHDHLEGAVGGDMGTMIEIDFVFNIIIIGYFCFADNFVYYQSAGVVMGEALQ